MQIIYAITFTLLAILLFIKVSFLFEKEIYWLRVQNKTKILIDFLFILLLTGLSILGSISTLNNYQVYFLIIYVACYFFLKEIYIKIIVERREIVFKIKMQKTIESEFAFTELFSQINSKPERNTIKTFFNTSESIRNRRWVNEYEDGVIGLLFEKQRYFFRLNNLEWSDSLSYIISQLEFMVDNISNIEDLEKIKIKIINNKKLAKEIAYEFIPYNQKLEKLKMPVVYRETIFNLTMISGYVAGSILINLLFSWISMSPLTKIINILIGALFSFEFFGGMFIICYLFIDTIKNKKIE